MHIALKTSLIAAPVLALIACGGGTVTTTGGTAGSTGSHGTGTSMTSSTGTGGKGSSTSATSGTGGSGTSVMQACADQAHAICAEREKCSENSFYNDANYGSEADCETRAVLTCATALMAKDSSQTPAHIETCVAAYPSESCTDFYDNNPPAACIPLPGGLANGAPCGANGQCMSTFCATGPFETCGTCQPLPSVGATCYVQADCGRNLACAKAAGANAVDPGICATRVMMGGSCVTGKQPCASGLSCVGEDAMTMTPGTCQLEGTAVGAKCDTTAATEPTCNSQDGLACIPTNGRKGVGSCQTIQLVGAGKPCAELPGGTGGTFMFTSFGACEAGGQCIGPDGAKTCVAAAADGAACDNDPTVGPPCLNPAKCVTSSGDVDAGTSGKCTVPDATKCM